MTHRQSRFARRCAGVAAVLALAAPLGCAMGPEPRPNAADRCPSWVYFPADQHSNAETRYLGCANTTNLATMLDRPSDAASGRSLGPANAERESIAVTAHDESKVKPFQDTTIAGPSIVLPGGNAGAQ